MQTYLLIAAVIGLLPGFIAQRKALPERRGRQFLTYWLFGAALFIVALPLALMLKNENERLCPECAEKIQVAARVCPHCRADLTLAPAEADGSLASRMPPWWR